MKLQECAEWLGIVGQLPKIDTTEESNKPILTIEQENLIKNLYKDDIILWNSIQCKQRE